MEKRINVLLMVSWYGPRGERPTGGIFHYEQAIELNKYCNCAIYYPYDRIINEDVVVGDDWGVVTYRSKYKLENKIRNRINMYKAMKKIVREFKPDIIHGNVATEAGRYAVTMGQLFHIPVIISEHSAAEYSGVTSFPHHMYANRVYRLSNYNTCVSDHLTEKLKEIFPKYEFHTVYDGIMPVDRVLTGEIQNYRKEGLVNIVCVAGFYDRYIKGIQYLLPAYKNLIEDGEKVYLHIIGGGTYLDEYKEMATDLGIADSIAFYGACERSKVYNIVSDSDFIVSASLVESFGCSVAEGVMLGKPAVGTRCGGLESIINDKTGILVNTKDEDGLYVAIKTMISEYKGYDFDELGKFALERFSIEVVTKQYLDIYDKIVNI